MAKRKRIPKPMQCGYCGFPLTTDYHFSDFRCGFFAFYAIGSHEDCDDDCPAGEHVHDDMTWIPGIGY